MTRKNERPQKWKNKQIYEHYTKLIRPMMECPAWQDLSTTAQAAYPWVKLEWKGENYNNNGKIQISARQLARAMGISKNTAAKALRELQSHGFIAVRQAASLGVEGMGKSHCYEITELAMPGATQGTKLYKN